jgi:FKBP-type peptidyl-prolyl cis-trans isomerase FkpA
MKRIFLLFLAILSLNGCKRKKILSQAEADENKIKKYITDNQLNAAATGSGLYYVITNPGTGANPNRSSNITVVYKGYLTDGSVFDESKSTGFNTNLTSVIAGWQEGIPYFKKGGKGKLLIPSALGYGAQAVSSIPANSVLIFDIELLDVK